MVLEPTKGGLPTGSKNKNRNRPKNRNNKNRKKKEKVRADAPTKVSRVTLSVPIGRGDEEEMIAGDALSRYHWLLTHVHVL